mgnify:CR=1 FL=1
MKPEPVLRLEGVTKEYGEEVVTRVLHDIDLTLEQGEFAALIGPSGSGKSTLLRILACLDSPDSGRVLLGGEALPEPWSRGGDRYRNQRCGIVLQDFALMEHATALENVMLPLELEGRSDARQRAATLLERVGLGHRLHHKPAELSGGERQRVAIARALVNRPGLVLLDEPTGNLDPRLAAEIMGVFEDINRLGTTVLIASHDLALIARMRHRMLTLQRGRLIGDGEAS